jgi:hypothetical protein
VPPSAVAAFESPAVIAPVLPAVRVR